MTEKEKIAIEALEAIISLYEREFRRNNTPEAAWAAVGPLAIDKATQALGKIKNDTNPNRSRCTCY